MSDKPIDGRPSLTHCLALALMKTLGDILVMTGLAVTAIVAASVIEAEDPAKCLAQAVLCLFFGVLVKYAEVRFREGARHGNDAAEVGGIVRVLRRRGPLDVRFEKTVRRS